MNKLDKHLKDLHKQLQNQWLVQNAQVKQLPNQFNKDALFMIEVKGKEVRNLLNHLDTKQPKGYLVFKFQKAYDTAHEKAFDILMEIALKDLYGGLVKYVKENIEL